MCTSPSINKTAVKINTKINVPSKVCNKQHSTYTAANSHMCRYYRIMDECKLLEDLHSGWFATEQREYSISQV